MDDRVSAVERRIEELAREIVETIAQAEDAGRPGTRTELKDFTIGLLNDALAGTEPVDVAPVAREDAPFNPLGMAIPVCFAGVVLIFLFPPVGILLFGVAALMIVWGLTASLLWRR
jgi:hypothetical protein